MVTNELNQLQSFGFLLPLVFLLVAAFILNVALTRALAQQRPQIAAVKALGYGNRAIGCKINGKISPLVSELVNGDEVEILTSKAQTAPPAAWESIVLTGKARLAIRKATRTGRPFGSEGFIDALEFQLNQSLRPGKPGRPRKTGECP